MIVEELLLVDDKLQLILPCLFPVRAHRLDVLLELREALRCRRYIDRRALQLRRFGFDAAMAHVQLEVLNEVLQILHIRKDLLRLGV